MNQDLKKFILYSTAFMSPVIIFFGLSYWIMEKTGELVNLNSIIRKKPDLIGFAYSDPYRYLKIEKIKQVKPDILVLGSSRSSQIRSFFFKRPELFYNGFIGGQMIEDFNIILDMIPDDAKPKIILAGLDYNFFDYEAFASDKSILSSKYSTEFGRTSPLNAWKFGYTQFYKDIFHGKIPLFNIIFNKQPGKVGLNALINGDGILEDGSYYDQRVFNDTVSGKNKNYKNTFIEEYFGQLRNDFRPDNKEYALNEVEEFLNKAKDRGINVIGFTPPYANIVLKKIDLMDKRFEHLRTINSELNTLFKKYGFNYFNFLDNSKTDQNDEGMIEATHASEKTMLYLLIEMAKKDGKLIKEINIKSMEKKLKDSVNDFFISED